MSKCCTALTIWLVGNFCRDNHEDKPLMDESVRYWDVPIPTTVAGKSIKDACESALEQAEKEVVILA